MPKSYVYDDPNRGIMLRNREIAVRGTEIPVDQIDPKVLEKLLKAQRVKIVTKKVVKEEPKLPAAEAGPKKGKGGKK